MPRPQRSIILENPRALAVAIECLRSVRELSVRTMAGEMGISHPQLALLLGGKTKRLRMLTWKKILLWAVRQRHAYRDRKNSAEYRSVTRALMAGRANDPNALEQTADVIEDYVATGVALGCLLEVAASTFKFPVLSEADSAALVREALSGRTLTAFESELLAQQGRVVGAV